MRDIAIVPNKDGKTYDIRTMLKGWGIVGAEATEAEVHSGVTCTQGSNYRGSTSSIAHLGRSLSMSRTSGLTKSARRKARG